MAKIGKQIRQLRMQKNMTQDELAEVLETDVNVLLYGQAYSMEQITHILPDVWYQLVMKIMNFFAYLYPRNPSMNIFYILWFITGIGLWCTKPDSHSLL